MDNALPLPGKRLGSFLTKQHLPVPELNLTAVTLLHEPTGARLLHLACDDPNNVFAVGFVPRRRIRPASPISSSIQSSADRRSTRYAIRSSPCSNAA